MVKGHEKTQGKNFMNIGKKVKKTMEQLPVIQ